MKNIFFTGATGLLGEYLLRDGLLAGGRFAVLVRPGKLESARSRIETLLARVELREEIVLPRPVVLEGNLSEENLGLAPDDLRWVSKNCDQILHNAASLSFYEDEKTGEPYRSNVQGTHHVLDFAEKTGIRNFHHVSTAYVCGLRNDLCYESQLDVGQQFGNDYERSKVEAEKMVRSAKYFDSLTVFRPAIIIGDSQTGYTSTYHGFFTPLKVAHVLVANAGGHVIDGSPFVSALGFNGSERKNFVPVDWVASVMTHVIQHRKYWNETYHLVPRNRVTVSTTTKIFEEAIRRFYADKETKQSNDPPPPLTEAQATFRTQMNVYQSYWKDDPEFDYSHVSRVAPNNPCPTVDDEMLLRMAMFALENGFGWPKKPPIVPKFDAHEALKQFLFENPSTSVKKIGLQVNGSGGGQWTLSGTASSESKFKIQSAVQGLPTGSEALIYMNSTTFELLRQRKIHSLEALKSGAVTVEFQESEIWSSDSIESLLHAI